MHYACTPRTHDASAVRLHARPTGRTTSSYRLTPPLLGSQVDSKDSQIPLFICARSETESAFEPEARPPLFPRGPTSIKGDGAILPNRGKHLVPSRKTLIFRFPAVPGGIPARPGRQPDYPSQAPAVGLRQGLAAPEQNRLTAETLVFSAGYPGPWPPVTTPSSCANAPTSCVKFSAASPTKRPSRCSRLRSPSWKTRRS